MLLLSSLPISLKKKKKINREVLSGLNNKVLTKVSLLTPLIPSPTRRNYFNSKGYALRMSVLPIGMKSMMKIHLMRKHIYQLLLSRERINFELGLPGLTL